MTSSRRLTALAAGLVISTLLLGGGWLFAGLRERAAQERAAMASLARVAEVVRGAVDESLEELREREDERPFYLYNYYYSPPDVLAISDPVAVSPLAVAPSDPRIVGYFQINPGGLIQTPYSPDAQTPAQLDTRMRQMLSHPDFERLRALAIGPGDDGDAPGPQITSLLTLNVPTAAPDVSPPMDVNAWGNAQAADIGLAQQGDALANTRVQMRGRQMPTFRREDVSWAQATAARARNAARGAARPQRPDVRAAGLGNLVQRETEVRYTPMVFADAHSQILLQRLVTHEGVTAVQGLVLDRSHLEREWIPQVVARHAAAAVAPAVVSDPHGCLAHFPASAHLEGLHLCFSEGALRAADVGTSLGWQLAALIFLLALSLLAASAILASARRSDALSRQKSVFVSAVSHELRTPLTTLRMHAEMLDEGLVTEERRPKVHRELARESVRLARLVDNVLSLSSLEEGRRQLELSDGDLRAHVRDVVESQRARVEERGFTLIGPADDAPLLARFDHQAVDQIVVNLIENAVKYADSETKKIEVTVDPPAVIRVLDRGPGVPESERERVFERFHRVQRQEHSHAPGTGIGLSLVRELAEAHGGRASVNPRKGGGLEVRVDLGG